jgi:hypothetical protein
LGLASGSYIGTPHAFSSTRNDLVHPDIPTHLACAMVGVGRNSTGYTSQSSCITNGYYDRCKSICDTRLAGIPGESHRCLVGDTRFFHHRKAQQDEIGMEWSPRRVCSRRFRNSCNRINWHEMVPLQIHQIGYSLIEYPSQNQWTARGRTGYQCQ